MDKSIEAGQNQMCMLKLCLWVAVNSGVLNDIRVTTLSLIAAGSYSTPLSVWTIERIGPELVGACGLWSCHQVLL